ncbi:MAG: AAA family ATPase [bacterium]|nr:AAA family ATPase [bacterium]
MCASCGSENKPTRRFCRDCGKPLNLACQACGATNDPVDKFCGTCGAAIDVQPAAGKRELTAPDRDPNERRFVAVLFADLVSFTEFSEARDHEIVRATLTDYYDRAREIVHRYGGSVQKFIGDAVMAVWGATVAHEDDAERALRAGLELVDMVRRLGNEPDRGELSLRVGVLTGEASIGPETPELGLVVGDLVNTASRLQTLAEPGTVVVGEATHRMLGDAVVFEALGEHSFKGKSKPMAVWRVVRVNTDRTRRIRSGLEPDFVGRREEIHLLKDAVNVTQRTGRSRLVSIVGEAGIGKSRLALELRKYVGGLARDTYWHEGRSPAFDQGLTLWALGEMVRQRAGIAETDDPLRSRTKLRTAVAEYVASPSDQEWIEPRLAALLGLDSTPTDEPNEFFAAVRSFFQSIAERGTTVLVFEDFHWADEGLIQFVSQLVERSPSHPILVVTLSRPDLLDHQPGWGAGRRNSTSVHLGPLTDAEMTELVAGMVRGIGDDVTTAVVDRANGIPLYAVELVRMLIADGDLEIGDDCCRPTRDLSNIAVPDTVRAVVAARLDRLSLDARALLQDAAVLGASFTRGGLAAMIGPDRDRIDELLELLVRSELLEFESDPRSPGRGQYRFVQSMIREVAYRRVTRDERRVKHIRAAEYFAQLGESEFAGAVASHYMSAHNVADAPDAAAALAAEATTALSDAADRAAGLHSHAQALAMIEHALTFVTDPAVRADLMQRAARSASALARHQTAVGYATQAFDWYRTHGDADDIADAAALLGNWLCHAFRAPVAIEVLEPIVGADPGFSSPAVVGAASGLARAYLMTLRNREAAELGDRLMGPAERFGLLSTIVNTLITRGTALGNLGRLHEAIALLRGAAQYAQEHDQALPEMRAANNLGHLLAYDDHAGAMDACRMGMEQANRLGDVRFIGSFTWAVAAYLDRDGRPQEARALRAEARERVELPGSSIVWYDLSDLIVRVEYGDESAIDAAYAALERSIDEENPQSEAALPFTRARLKMITGELDAAYTVAMSVDGAHLLPDHLAVATSAAALLGNTDQLQVVIDALASSRTRGRMVVATSDVALASKAALEGRTEEAVAGFLRALSFGWLRLDRATLQGLFAAVVGREVAEARQASDAACQFLSDIGATAYLDLYAAGMPPIAEERASGA